LLAADIDNPALADLLNEEPDPTIPDGFPVGLSGL
jgi:hypothetical protein